MPVAGSGKGGRGNKPAPVVIYDPTTGGSTQPAPSSTSSSSGGSTTKPLGSGKGGSGAGAGGSSTGSSSYDKYLAAQKREAQKAKNLAAQRYTADAEAMQGQVNALRKALRTEFKQALNGKLANLDILTGQQLTMMMQGYDERTANLDEDAKTNRIAADDTTVRAGTNRVRERASALAELANQGGGESDGLRAQLMSLRSEESNLAETNRAFFDGERSINAARIDLGVDTRTGLANIYSEADADRAQLWNDYYGQQAETRTQLGNTLGQQAEYYGLAAEQGGARTTIFGSGGRGGRGGKGGRGGRGGEWETAQADGPKEFEPSNRFGVLGGRTAASEGGQAGAVKDRNLGDKGGKGGKGGKGKGGKGKGGRTVGSLEAQAAATEASDRAFMQAANWMGKSYKSEGIPDSVMNFKGPELSDSELGSSLLQNARTTIKQKAPEGATLRKW